MKFDKPLKLARAKIGRELEFDSAESVREWIYDQRVAWVQFAERVGFAAEQIPDAARPIARHAADWTSVLHNVHNTLESGMPDDQKESALQSELNSLGVRLVKHEMLDLHSPIAARAIAASAIDARIAVWIFMMATGLIVSLLARNDRGLYAAYGEAMAFLSTQEAIGGAFETLRVLSERLQRDQAQLSGEVAESSQLISSLKSQRDSFFSQFEAEQKGLLSTARQAAEGQGVSIVEDWQKLRNSLRAEFKLREPRGYWSEKLTAHTVAAKRWRTAFLLTAVGGLAVLGGGLAILVCGVVDLTQVKEIAWVVPAVVLGVPGFITLWLLRMFGRNWNDHLMRVEDARERMVLIDTFLALSRDAESPGAISDPIQLGLVLSAIFRPGFGMGTDDSPPAGFLEAALSRITTDNSRPKP